MTTTNVHTSTADFTAWANGFSDTDEYTSRIIFDLANGDTDIATRIWTDPTAEEAQQVIEAVNRDPGNFGENAGEAYMWGDRLVTLGSEVEARFSDHQGPG